MSSSAPGEEVPVTPAKRVNPPGLTHADFRPSESGRRYGEEETPSGHGGVHGAHGHADGVELPAPTTWPMVLALGVTLGAFGLVTSWTITACGIVIFFVGLAGWIMELQPGRGHYHVPLAPEDLRPLPIEPHSISIQHLQPGSFGHRMQVPERVHPYSAGMRGGIYGGIAMAVIAGTYGVFSEHGIWFPVNVLAAMVLPTLNGDSVEQLQQFQLDGLVVGVLIHVFSSLIAGLMYGLLLPMMPRHPIILGGLIAPFLWTGFLHSYMGVLDPELNDHVNWLSFIAAQFAFGLVAGITVVRTQKVYSSELWKHGEW